MAYSPVKNIKREQKKSLFFRLILKIVHALGETEKTMRDVYVTRVDFSADSGICYIYFATYSEEAATEQYEAALETLKLYKGSLRKALSQEIHARYIPELLFLYDTTHEKQRRVEDLLFRVQSDLAAVNQSCDTNPQSSVKKIDD